MVTSGIYFDGRKPKKDGTCPIKVRIIKDRKVSMMSTGLSCLPEEWENERISKSAKNSMQKNALLNKWMSEIDGTLLDAERRGELDLMTITEIMAMVERVIKGESAQERNNTFCDVLDEMVERKNYKNNTKSIYVGTREKVDSYCSGVKLADITPKWLDGFQSWMIKEGLRTNSIGIHMRNVRAVFNFAIDEEYTTSYPFRKFSIKKEETEKRCLTIEQIRALKDFKCEEYQKPYRDIFMLMFYLIGINAVDLFEAKKSQVRNGRLEYRRAKTNKLYSIKIEPEAQEIIDRYAGKEYLLNFMEKMEGTNYHQYLYAVNRGLRKIGEFSMDGLRKDRTPIEKNISTYWSRHTWATIAAEINIPIEVISHALGHKIGSDVTAIYVKFNRMKVDEANRKVIDHVNQKEG